MKRNQLILLIALATAGLVGGALFAGVKIGQSGHAADRGAAVSPSTHRPPSPSPSAKVLRKGESVTFTSRDLQGSPSKVTYTVTGVLYLDRDSFGNRPDKHEVFVVAEVLVQVHEGQHTPGFFNAFYAFSLVDQTGTLYRSSPHVVEPELSGTLSAGQTTRGNVVFDVPLLSSIEGTIQLEAKALDGSSHVQWAFKR